MANIDGIIFRITDFEAGIHNFFIKLVVGHVFRVIKFIMGVLRTLSHSSQCCTGVSCRRGERWIAFFLSFSYFQVYCVCAWMLLSCFYIEFKCF